MDDTAIQEKRRTAGAGSRAHRPFTLVLGGGGARGLAHVGVLRGLEKAGHRPAALVGVSMGAIVAVTYTLRRDWYRVLRDVGLPAVPSPPDLEHAHGPRKILSMGRALRDLTLHWGIAEGTLQEFYPLLDELTLGRSLEDARVPVAVCTTDLGSGTRVVLRTGQASDAASASAALAGVIPPVRFEERLLADGAYTDIAPIDVARDFGHPVVIAVDPGQQGAPWVPRNGLEALTRAMEICHSQHAELRFARADFVLRPDFTRPIGTLEFSTRRACIAAGLRAVRSQRHRLENLLRAEPTETVRRGPAEGRSETSVPTLLP